MTKEIKHKALARLSYSRSLKSGLTWFHMAYSLRESSLVLRRSCARSEKRNSDQELMLLGFAFENLFKSYFIATHPIEENLPRSIATHQLLKLRDKVISWPASPEEKALLEKLTTAVVWQGRYPIALRSSHNVKSEISKKELRSLDRIWQKYTNAVPKEIMNEYAEIRSALTRKRATRT